MDFRWNILDREYINYYKTKSIIIHTEIYVKQIYNMFNSLNYNTNQILLRIKFLLMALLVHEKCISTRLPIARRNIERTERYTRFADITFSRGSQV